VKTHIRCTLGGPSRDKLGGLDMVWPLDVEGRRIVQRLVDLEMPVVATVNGPATVYSEYALLADIVVASEMAAFGDVPALCPSGEVQGTPTLFIDGAVHREPTTRPRCSRRWPLP
jgi:hypothetical protein